MIVRLTNMRVTTNESRKKSIMHKKKLMDFSITRPIFNLSAWRIYIADFLC